MFRRILVANRGEVAARVIRTASAMGIETVAVTTDVDADLSYLRDATVVAPIGDRRAYLDADALIAAGLRHRCSAVHPGWGFLSENPSFAARCEAARLTFVGPDSASMRRMADKAEARRTMTALGVAPVPGSPGPVAGLAEARAEAARIGFPVLLKAVSGGGGRGMRRVYAADGLEDAFRAATAEAQSAFGDARLYLEKLIEHGRHIELQVLCDGHRAFVLGERECSVQRRHQKLVEETPSPAIDEGLRAQVFETVERACVALGYRGAGTVEMLLDQDGGLWFMEMNTRLQVEHTVTEAVRGIDLVEWQLRIAANEPLPADLLERHPAHGHAIECRINAERVADDFRPVPGPVDRLELPSGDGVRVDTHLSAGDRVSPHYDSMIAKLITHGDDRAQAIERMLAALQALRVDGVPTTASLHGAILQAPAFRSGRYDTRWLETVLGDLLASTSSSTETAPSEAP